MTESAQVFNGIHDIPVYTDVIFNKPLRLAVAIPLGAGGALTVVASVLALDSGHARTVLLGGLLITAATAGAGALIPCGRPNLAFRLRCGWRVLRPTAHTSAPGGHPLLAPPRHVIANLRFTAHGVYADYLLTGLRAYLQPVKNRIAVADRHAALARELPSGSWLYGFSVPQDQRQLLRAMLHGHRHQPDWVNACRRMQTVLAEHHPRTRIHWLTIPVDAGRAGHSPAGQLAKIGDWLAGRDRHCDTSLAAYHRLADDIITALPPEFAPLVATADMIDWFWRHNAWRGTYTEPLPRRETLPDRLDAQHFPVAGFDEADQAHRGPRPVPLRWLPSFSKPLRIASPDGRYPDSYQAILPVIDMPKQGIAFPGSEFLDALDDLDTGATFDWAIHLVMRSRETEFVRNDRAKGNIDDQFGQRRDVRDGLAQLAATGRQLAEYNRLLSADADERALAAAFLVAVGAPDPATLDYSIKRLRDALSQSGKIVIRHYRGAQTRLWAAFNPGAAIHRSGVDQFTHPTTAGKWSRFAPITSTHAGATTGILLGFSQANANNSAVLIDLPATARRNRNPCLVCAGALGYGKSYAAKRYVRAELQRGSQAFIIDPGTEWATAFGDNPNTAVIDMAGSTFGCDPLRIFPHQTAGGYWLDYMIPLIGLDPKSLAVARLRQLLAPDTRARLGITSTAALIHHIAAIQPPCDGPDRRPPHIAALADDLRGALITLQSWATHDFTRAIFDPALPVPDLAQLDATIWLTGDLDLPTAEEMSTPHLYAQLSERKLASVAIYGMLVRLARLTFFADPHRFGLIVLEEAAALLNSRAGADDAHLISRRARKHYTGLMIITQDPIADLALMGDQFITQMLIMPFEDQTLAARVARRAGLRTDDYPGIEEHFLAHPDPDQTRDPTTADPDGHTAPPSRRARHGHGFFIDEYRRPTPIHVAAEPDPALHAAYDTTPGTGAP